MVDDFCSILCNVLNLVCHLISHLYMQVYLEVPNGKELAVALQSKGIPYVIY
ncbi:hypothetical protein RchiOBHm_Chr1g0343141 [Rosa chinensis]|uniref:Uncharacterized protein n=1 Tax=Rosa chinensis TaxID=74649 RepID=A0A2P6SE67_ROSCH|nr:hypothetical protein RchiOBHm_Chr1g0343141 [Rosa chinensis]